MSVTEYANGMITAQLSYGSLSRNYENTNIEEKLSEEAVLAGRVGVVGATTSKVKVVSSATDIFAGVFMSAGALNDSLNLVVDGIVVCYAEEAVNEGDVVRVRHANDGNKKAGAFCTTSDAGKTAILEGAKFVSSTTTAGKVEIFVSKTCTLKGD